MSLPSPLEGVRVLDLSRVVAGPYATQILADLGAEIWKIERPEGGDDTRAWGPVEQGGETAYYVALNRNKRSVAVDLKTEGGRRIVRELASRADVVVENFPPGKLARLGLSFEDLGPANPRLVWVTISAFGPLGPLRDEPGYDLILQGYGGVMAVTGPADGAPYRVGIPIVDLTTGLNAALGALAALRVAERDGVGQRVEVSLFESHLSWLANVGSNALLSGQPSPRFGNAHPNVAPYEPFEARGGWLLLGVGNDGMWQRLGTLPEFALLFAEERWATNDGRVADREALAAALRPIFLAGERDGWLDRLRAIRVPGGPILRPDEALAHPQTEALGLVHRVAHPTAGLLPLVGSPLRMGASPVRAPVAPPLLGQNTDAVLRDVLGLDAAAIGALRADGAIGAPCRDPIAGGTLP